MNAHTALAVIVVSLCTVLGIAGYMRISGDTSIATECVKAGGEWVASWGQFECRHTK